jgi:alanyl-tRNA synthetase
LGKKEISTLFSSDPDKYYRVSLFDTVGFKRHKCVNCGKFFWSILDKEVCPDHENMILLEILQLLKGLIMLILGRR